MATYKQYEKNGTMLWMGQTYLGKDPVTGKDKRTTLRNFKTKKQAQLAINQAILDFENGAISNLQNVTVNELYDMWMEGYKTTVGESTLYKVMVIFEKHVLVEGALDGVHVVKVTTDYLQKIINKWASEFMDYKKWTTYLKRLFEYAVRRRIIPFNPFNAVEFPKSIQSRENGIDSKDNFWDVDTLHKFLDITERDYAKTNYKLVMAFRMIAFTGMRQGEMLALTWRDVSLVDNTVSINKGLTRGIDNRVFVGKTKTDSSNRTIILDDKTASMLKHWRLVQRNEMLVCGFGDVLANQNQLIFPNTKNEFLSLMKMNHWLNQITKKNNLPRISAHGFRHTYATLAIEAGMNVKQLQLQLGHSDVKTTLDVYASVTEKGQHASVETFAQYANF